MKQSHLTTPRTMGDCSFLSSGDPLDYENPTMHPSDVIVMWGCGLSLLALVVIVAINWS